MKKKIDEILSTILEILTVELEILTVELEILTVKLETHIVMKNEIWKDGYETGYEDACAMYREKMRKKEGYDEV